jgi:A/G-specific adenine glycosylase
MAARGVTADPYRIWLSEVMLQQTTVQAVKRYFTNFLVRWPTVVDLANAPTDDVMAAWAGLGYYARARNLKKCAEAVARDHGGVFPDSEERLKSLPGIGDYTAAAVAAIAFNRQSAVMDGNVERVISRLYAISTPLPTAKPLMKQKVALLVPADRPGDFAQAMMDLGATICTPKKPACGICPWMKSCTARERGDQESFPRKAPKVEGKLRRGASFVVTRADGHVLVRSRPEKGLLGGMTEVPSTAWAHDFDEGAALSHAPLKAKWKRVPGVVEHGFTHFPLEQSVYVASVPTKTAAPEGMRWVARAELHGEALPNVMRKIVIHAGLVPGRPT